MKSLFPPLILGSLCCLVLPACSPNQSAQQWLRKTEKQWTRLECLQADWPEMLDSTALQQRLSFLAEARQKAGQFTNNSAVSPVIKQQLLTLDTRLDNLENQLEAQQKDPGLYDLARHLHRLFDQDTLLGKATVLELEKSMDKAPVYYQQAKQKLQNPSPILCDSAVRQHISSITFLLGPLRTRLCLNAASALERQQLEQKIRQTSLQMKDYLAWCRSMVIENRN